VQFNRYTTYVFFSLSILILVYSSIFFHIFDVQFTTHDDINHYVAEYKDWIRAAYLQGRIEFYADGIYQHLLLANKNFVYYRSLQIFTISAIVFSLGFFINVLLKEKYIGYLYMILLATLWQNSGGHNLIGSYPLYKGMAFVFFLASLMTFIKYIRDGKIGYLIASLIFWSITLRGSEFWVVYAPFYIWFGFYEQKSDTIFKRFYRSIMVSKWHILLLIISTIIYLIYRDSTSGGFASNIVKLDSISTILSTWMKYTFGLTPGVQFYLNVDRNSFDYMLELIDIHMILTVIFSLFFMIIIRKYIKDIDLSKKSIFTILIAAIYGIFVPNFLISLTYKYQSGAEGYIITDYLYSSFSYFAIVLVLFLIFVLLKRSPKIYLSFALFISILILGTLLNNKYIGNVFERDNRRFFFLDAFVYSNYSKGLGDKPILISTLCGNAVSVRDLKALAKKKGKIDLNFIDKGDADNILIYSKAYDKDNSYMIYIEDNITKAIFTSSKRCNKTSPCYLVGSSENSLDALPEVLKLNKNSFKYRDINIFELNSNIPLKEISAITTYDPKAIYYHSRSHITRRIDFIDGLYPWAGGYGKDAWSDGNVTAQMYNDKNHMVKREIKFTMGTFQKRDVSIYIDGKLIKRVSLAPSQFHKSVDLILDIKPGKTLIEFKTDTPAKLPGNGNKNRVTFLISNVTYKEI